MAEKKVGRTGEGPIKPTYTLNTAQMLAILEDGGYLDGMTPEQIASIPLGLQTTCEINEPGLLLAALGIPTETTPIETL